MSIDKERADFEAAGTKLHGWGEIDYLRQDFGGNTGEYSYLEQRRAFALWQARAAIPPVAGLTNHGIGTNSSVDRSGIQKESIPPAPAEQKQFAMPIPSGESDGEKLLAMRNEYDEYMRDSFAQQIGVSFSEWKMRYKPTQQPVQKSATYGLDDHGKQVLNRGNQRAPDQAKSASGADTSEGDAKCEPFQRETGMRCTKCCARKGDPHAPGCTESGPA